MKQQISYIWVIPGALLFPALQLLIFWLRFHNIPSGMWSQSLAFAPIGLISAMALIYFVRKEDDNYVRKKMLLWYVAGIPFALFSSLGGGLFSTSPVFIGIYGSLPLIIGILIGRKKQLWLTIFILGLLWMFGPMLWMMLMSKTL